MTSETQTAPRPCGRCGRPINPRKESWKLKNHQMQHVTCPTGPALQTLPPLADPSPDTSPDSLPMYLTMDEAALLIRVSKGTIRNLIKSGQLPAKRLRGGRTVLVDRRDVLALLEDIRPGVEV